MRQLLILFVFGPCGRCPTGVSLRADIPRKDLGKLVFLTYSYPFFYICYQLVQDLIQLFLAEFLLRIVLVTRLLLLFLERVTPSPSPIDPLRILPIGPGS